MLYINSVLSILEVLILVISVLFTVAFVTVAERKTMGSMQRRLGPNIIGFYGILQAFADALKLLLKEYVSPTQSNIILFFIGPIITLIFSLLGYAVIPLSSGVSILNFDLSILYILAVSSLSTYGILLAGWSANSKYAFLGSLRSTAQLISYELILSSAILVVILLTGSLNLNVIIESQKVIWFIFPLFPVFIIFFIGSVAETNRAPFDLAEAESELVSGFMTEHAAVIFVFFFLAEYASIVLICILTSILFLGGYEFNINIVYIFIDIFQYISNVLSYILENTYNKLIFSVWGENLYRNYYPDITLYQFLDIYIYKGIGFVYWLQLKYDYYIWISSISPAIKGSIGSFILGIKTSIMVFIFIWIRASFPRIRFDQLMSFCWTVLLPIVIAIIIIIPCIMYVYCIFPTSIVLL